MEKEKKGEKNEKIKEEIKKNEIMKMKMKI